MTEPCWHERFGPDPCRKPGVYGRPDAPNDLLRVMRWCETHRHPDDVLVGPEPEPETPAEGQP